MTALFPQLRMWLAVTCALLLLQSLVFWFTPPMQITVRASDATFAQVWPFIDQLEYENDDPQQGRALRWAPMQGVIRMPQSVHVAPTIIRMMVHTARSPEQTPMHVEIQSDATTTSFAMNPGWRTLSFLTLPATQLTPYTQLTYTLQGPILSERRDLGVAVASVSLIQSHTPQIDGLRFVFVLGLWLWLIPLAMMRRWPVWSVVLPVLTVLVTWLVVPMMVAHGVPNQWNLIASLWLIAMAILFHSYRRPLVSFGWSIVLITIVVMLWQYGFGWIGVLVLLATWFFAKPWPMQSITPVEPLSSRWVWLLIGIAVIMAAFLRMTWLNEYPAGLFRDEARHGGLAWRILAGEWMVYSPLANLPAGYFYASAIPIALFDASPWSIRIVAAVVGTLTVPVLFWMVRMQFGYAVALWASGILATLLWHVGLSRIGFPATMGPLLTIIAVAAWLSMPQAKWPSIWAIVAGIATGLMLMVYHSARLMPVVVALTIVLVMWQQQWAWRKYAMVLLVYAVVTMAIASPIVWYAITQPENYMRRIGVTSIMADAQIRGLPVWVAVFENLHAYAGMLFVAGDRNPRHFNLGAPQLNIVEALAFVVGIVWLWVQHRSWLLWLLGWLAVGLISGVLSVDAPHALRTVESIIPIVVIVALGSFRLAQLATKPWIPIVFISLLMCNGAWSAMQYHTWQSNPRTQSRFDSQATHDVRFVQLLLSQAPTNRAVIYVPESMRRSDLGVFLLHNRGARVWQGDLTLLDQSRQHVVLVANDSRSTNWPVTAVRLQEFLPASMQSRYQLWCVGACTDVTWIQLP